MPEYLSPGVYVEETSFRSRAIEGVSTSTAGFVGPTSRGPIDGPPTLVTSFAEYQRSFGGLEDLTLGAVTQTHYLAHAVRAFFDNGGSRLYIARVFAGNAGADGCATSTLFKARSPGRCGNGRITLSPFFTPAAASALERAPAGTTARQRQEQAAQYYELVGKSGPFDLSEKRTLAISNGGGTTNVTLVQGKPEVSAAYQAPTDDVRLQVRIGGAATTSILIPKSTVLGKAVEIINTELVGGYARSADSSKLIVGSERLSVPIEILTAALGFPANTKAVPGIEQLKQTSVEELDAVLKWIVPSVGISVTRGKEGAIVFRSPTEFSVTGPAATVLNLPEGGKSTAVQSKSFLYWNKGADGTWSPIGHSASIAPVSDLDFVTLNVVTEDRDGFARSYSDVGLQPEHPRWIGNVLAEKPSRKSDAVDQHYFFCAPSGQTAASLVDQLLAIDGKSAKVIPLSGGADGAVPGLSQYESALARLARVEEISIVAAPGASVLSDGPAIQAALITHAEARRAYRIAVLDSNAGDSIEEIRNRRSLIDSKYAALYFPWVVVANPLARPEDSSKPKEIALPPSGAVCGVYARSDVERGVHKAPANEVLRNVLRLETDISFGEQEVLNPIGVNCLRFFPDRGNRIWGARTASSDSEWKYVNVRRYFNYLERSIDVGTQWVVFEPNGEHLWADIRDSISSFLRNEWRKGALLGSDPKDAFFVRCDRSTMDQNDLDNGRLVVLIGVAVVKPAEFVIFRIGQKTAAARS